MGYDVRVEQLASRPLAVVRRRARQAELPRVVPEACGMVWNALKSTGVTGAGRHVAVYLDDVINLEIGVELAAPFAGCGDIIGSVTPAGAVATTTHFGPYGELQRAHAAVGEWCQRHQRIMAGPSWEVYGHWEDDWNQDPSKIRTDVYYLL